MQAKSAGTVLKPLWLLAGTAAITLALAYRMETLHSPGGLLYDNRQQSLTALRTMLQKTPSANRLALLERMSDSSSRRLRYAAIDQTASLYEHTPFMHAAPTQAVQIVEQALHDEDSDVRQRALEALPQLDFNAGIHMLAAELADPDPWQAEEAASLLTQWAERHKKHTALAHDVVPSLCSALGSKDPNTVQFATLALCSITGNNWHVKRIAPRYQRNAVTQQWLKWWAGKKTAWKVDASFRSMQPPAITRTDPCPRFTASTLQGNTVSNSTLRGHVALLNFWGLNCGPCIAEMPQIEAAYRQFKQQGVQVYGIAADGSAQSVSRFCSSSGITYPQIIADSSLLHDFGNLQGVPVTYLINANGRITRIWEGGPRIPAPFGAAIVQAQNQTAAAQQEQTARKN